MTNLDKVEEDRSLAGDELGSFIKKHDEWTKEMEIAATYVGYHMINFLLADREKQALAELEKPAEELSDIYDDLGEIAGVKVAERMLSRIEKFAESYHAKKCAECKELMGTDDVSDREA